MYKTVSTAAQKDICVNSCSKIEKMEKIERREMIIGCTDKYAGLTAKQTTLTFTVLLICRQSGLPFNTMPDKQTFAVQYNMPLEMGLPFNEVPDERHVLYRMPL